MINIYYNCYGIISKEPPEEMVIIKGAEVDEETNGDFTVTVNCGLSGY